MTDLYCSLCGKMLLSISYANSQTLYTLTNIPCAKCGKAITIGSYSYIPYIDLNKIQGKEPDKELVKEPVKEEVKSTSELDPDESDESEESDCLDKYLKLRKFLLMCEDKIGGLTFDIADMQREMSLFLVAFTEEKKKLIEEYDLL